MKPELYGLGVVLIGSFNPKIFHPAWFASQGLIMSAEAEEAAIDIVHNDITIFRLEWLRLEITRERFNISTEQEPFFEPLKDLVSGTFSLLKHTPTKFMGINSSMHFRMKSESEWHLIGDSLAPKGIWEKYLTDKPGMLGLEIEEHRKGGPKGQLRIRVEPSRLCHPGVFFNFNDHFEVADPDKSLGSEELMNILETNWRPSLKKSEEIAVGVLTDIVG